MKKLLLSALCLLMAIVSIKAEETSSAKRSQLHMKSGELITGNIVSRNDSKVVIIEDGSQYEYNMSDIAYISHDQPAKKYDRNRFRGFVDVGYGMGIGSPRENTFKIETSFGYQFSHYLYVGAGIAVHFNKSVLDSYPVREDVGGVNPPHNDPEWNFPFVPLYVNVRSQLFEGNRITPFVDVKAGLSIFNHKGFYASPSIGLHVPTSSFLSLNFAVGYSMQHGSYKLWTRGDTPGAIGDGSGKSYLKKDITLSNIDFRIGIEF